MSLPIRAVLLAGIPLLVMTVIGVALIIQGQPAEGRSMIAVGVIAGATAGASVLYQVERWSLFAQSAAHFGIMLVTVLPALFLSGWFPLETAADCLVVIGVFLFTGAVLWTVFYLVFAQLIPRLRTTRNS